MTVPPSQHYRKNARHVDGTKCKEGTASVPARFVPCCETFANHTTACELDVRYEWWREKRQWVIAIAESAGGGGIRIAHCPHCGSRLGSTHAP